MNSYTLKRILDPCWRALLTGLTLFCLLPGQSWAPPACPNPPCGNPASCDNALTITEVQPMNFGSMVAVTAGTVVLGTDGTRINTGGVQLVGATSAAGLFSVSTGARDCTTYPLVTLSVTSPATLTHLTLPANTLTVDTFTTNPVAGVTFSPTLTIAVGATLNVATGQVPGDYQGTYLITATFQ